MQSVKLVDQYGRVATDLRVSLTDHCNLRCQYCLPESGISWLPKPELLTDAELLKLIEIAIALGVTEVRFTGGEPMLRASLPDLITAVAAMNPRPEISMTTNGIGLDKIAVTLAKAGLDRINVSLDSTDAETFKKITRRDRHSEVVAGLAAAKAAGISPVKVNAVLLRELNFKQAPELLRWCLDHDYQLRFIEQMPLDAGHGWDRNNFVTATETLKLLQQHFELTPATQPRGSAPAELFSIAGESGLVGIIGSVSAPFCGACDRLRLTADGQLRNCLFANQEANLRDRLRAGASDAELAEIFYGNIWQKLPGHGINDPSFLQPDRPMSAIGG